MIVGTMTGASVPYLRLREMFAVVHTRWRADVVKLALKLGDVALDEGQTQLESLVRIRRAGEREAAGSSLADLVELEVASGGLAQGKGGERSKDQARGNHLWTSRLWGGKVDETLGDGSQHKGAIYSAKPARRTAIK